MGSNLKSSARLLSTLIRSSNGFANASTFTHRTTRPIGLFTSQLLRFSTHTTDNSQTLFDRDASQTGSDLADRGNQHHKSRTLEAPVSAMPKGIDSKPLESTTLQLSSSLLTPHGEPTPSVRKAKGPKREDTQSLGPSPPTHIAGGPRREHWQTQKDALKRKFGEQGWHPRKKLSPDTMEGIRALHEQFPDKYTTPELAEQFKVSPESIRRILKSKWRPSSEQMQERRVRWARRHDRIWDAQAELGLKPPRKKDRKPEGPEKLDDILPLMQNVGP